MMERLKHCRYCGAEYSYSTWSEDVGEVERHEECPKCGYFYDFSYSEPHTNQEVYEELKSYRDTNLTPAEITALQEENAELKAALEDEREHHNVYVQLMSDKCATLTKAMELKDKALEMACERIEKLETENGNEYLAFEIEKHFIHQARSAINSKEGEK